ncbi:DUF4082 domain-containing protein [Sinomonas atrocyanea]|uniref:DUF4082 domain-containing protein n=1 Tax=Sinomonas atrocyanea TaxID=37927 RepID=UPI003D96DC5D
MVSGAGDSTIVGFATSMSVNAGETVSFKVHTTASAWRYDVYRLGYYQGLGARKVAANQSPTLIQPQPACQTYSDTGLIDCGNWSVSASWAVPANAVSGVYIARIVRSDTGGASWVPFVVRNDGAASDILVKTSDETWQAYNSYGGNSLYQCTVSCPAGNPRAYKAAYKVSYNRPFHTALDDQGRSWLTYAELPMIRFLEANGYDIGYMSGFDVASRPALVKNHKVFVSSGHDEYWSQEQRDNVEAARDAGVNLAFFSGNEVFWRTRWEASRAGTTTAGRTLVAYKDTHFDTPTDPVSWTGTWADPRFGTASGGGNPQNALTGQFFNVNFGQTDIQVPAAYSKMRLWRNTAVANLTGSQVATLGSGLGTLGYEWDLTSDNGFRPPGLVELSSTTNTNAEVFIDYGSQTASGKTATHHLSVYRAPSGALVFGAGTVQWAWGLDSFTTAKATDPTMRQATVNLLADMGVQPRTLQTGLTAATASVDTSRPTSAISTPATGTTVADGTLMTVTGTASDSGGTVAGVEVSTDGGASWHPAVGTTSWTYSWLVHGSPSTLLKSRAVDDSGNQESPAAGRSLSVTCPCSIMGVNVAPAAPDAGDGHSVEVGAKFYSTVNGNITAIRFYKSSLNTGTHTGSIWDMAGNRLATVTFSSESATGWQTATFATPLAITANTMYVVSYFAPKGHYAQDAGYFYPHPSPAPAGNGSVDSAPLHFTRSTPSSPNGFYVYSATSTFPNLIYDAEYYWVDVAFQTSTSNAPTVLGTTPNNGDTDVALNIAPSAVFNQNVTASSISFTLKDAAGATVAGSTSYSATASTATFTPASALAYGTTYTATVSGATNSAGQAMTSPYSWSFTTAPPPKPPVVSSTSPSDGATGVAVSTAPTATFDQDVAAASVTFTLKDSAGTAVPGNAVYASSTRTVTFTPNAALAYSTTYTANVSGATNSTGQTMASPYSWSFTTAAPPPPPTSCPCSVFASTATPAVPTVQDPSGVQLGMKFRSDTAGNITAIRFYKGTQNTGTHTGYLWTSTGTRLATVTFANETASGWQQATLTSPVAVTANTTYIVSYYAPNGFYSANGSYFNASADNPPLHGLASGTDGPNGVYLYGSTTTVPTNSYNNTNYWVDVVLTTGTASAPAPVVSSTSPSDGATGVAVSTAPTATFDQDVAAASVTFTLKDSAGTAVPGNAVYASSTRTVTFTPNAALAYSTTYTANVSGATNSTGQTMASPYSWSFTTAAPPPPPTSCPCSVFASTATPAVPTVQDPSGVQLGMKFRSDTAGNITAIRFYKGTQNTGTHTGYLWTSTGTRLATVTFANETASGWQQATLTSPVAVTANTTYIVSYYAPNGFYSANGSYFNASADNPPLHGLASGTDGPNGVYLYGSTTTVPTNSYNNTNYWVDVVLTTP